MDLKTIVEKIKTYLSEEVKLMEAKTTDGIILNFDKLEVGSEIFVVDENGQTPAPDSTYTLEDGTILVVVSGKIETVTAPEAPVEGEPEAETPEVEVEAEVKSDNTELISRIEALEKENSEIKDILLKIAENLGKVNFKQELKEETEPKKEVQMAKFEFKPNRKNNSPLNTIFKNMYK